MSLEQKIQAILGKKPEAEVVTEAKVQDNGVSGSTSTVDPVPTAKETLPLSNDNGEAKPVKQGSSADAEVTELDPEITGASAAAPVGQAPAPAVVGDAKSVKTQANEGITKMDLTADIAALFEGQDGLAEEFVSKATGLFEAAVVARVAAEVEKVKVELEENAATELTELKTALTEQVDQYMNYVVEGWMKENQVAIDSGLRTEIAEGFISGLKDLFTENFIEVPQEKVDVLEELSNQLEASKETINEHVAASLELKAQVAKLERQAVLESASKGMTAIDADRFLKLVEGVEFESTDLFAAQVAVIKESHFKKPAKKSAETLLAESTGDGGNEAVVAPSVQRYVDALTKRTKF